MSGGVGDLENLAKAAGEAPARKGGPPFPWPDICGAFDIRIDRDGTWYYMGTPFNRKRLVKLLSTVIRRDSDGGYWLVTPVEAGRITVDDVPFTAVEVNGEGEGQEQVLTLRTNLDDQVRLDTDHPLRIAADDGLGTPLPYVLVRDNLEARILRSAWYQLVERGVEADDGETFGVWSAGTFFELGRLSEAA